MNETEKRRRIAELLDHPISKELDMLMGEIIEQSYPAERIPLPTLAQAMEFRRQQMGESPAQIAARAGIGELSWIAMEHDLGDPSMDEAKGLFRVGIPAEVILQ